MQKYIKINVQWSQIKLFFQRNVWLTNKAIERSQVGEERERVTFWEDKGKERICSGVCTSELLDAQELALFGHSLGLENIQYHSNSVYNYRHIQKPAFMNVPYFFHSWQNFPRNKNPSGVHSLTRNVKMDTILFNCTEMGAFWHSNHLTQYIIASTYPWLFPPQ